MAAAEVSTSRERPARPASIDPAVAALLDHIAEDLAREYVRSDGTGRPRGRRGRIPEWKSEEGLAMRAAIYARYSSENQRPESIEDQTTT